MCLRRIYQLKELRPDLNFIEIRGNIFTRIQKVLDKELDGVILAKAGLKRCQIENYISEVFSVETLVPAVAQGALAIQTRADSQDLINLLKPVHNSNVETCIKAERAFLKAIGGGCKMPLGAYATINNSNITILGFLSNNQGNVMAKHTITESLDSEKNIGEKLAENLLQMVNKK
jgi:hydroxymethylbilane synthase